MARRVKFLGLCLVCLVKFWFSDGVLQLSGCSIILLNRSDVRLLCVGSVAQLCLTLCDPMDYSPPGSRSSVYGISQTRILKWFAISFSKGSFWPRNWTHVSCVSCIGRWILYHWATWETPPFAYNKIKSQTKFHQYTFIHLASKLQNAHTPKSVSMTFQLSSL